YELGTRFSRHHQVMAYYDYLEQTVPDRIKIEPYGETYEHRKLMVAYVSSPENIANLERIRLEQLNAAKGRGNAATAIVWLSYNVHGNESVSTEASMQTAYELITQKQDWLKNTVVIIDPCINPDGRDRYVNWYNQFANTPYQADMNSKEHNEPWLSGRTNHYMFDLNRDWAWITQTESRQRLPLYNRWLPHVHVDFHEQGVDEPYYFAPAAEPLHEVVTDWQREFQVAIGKNHAKYFDAEGWLYFTKEIFDLLYPSYGDTYPAFNGAIGMTYEQGGSGQAGLGVMTGYGDLLTLKDRIAHHHTTGLSTVEMAAKNADRLIPEFKKFYTGRTYRYKSYVLGGNPDNVEALTRLLDAHEITYGFSNGATVKGYDYKTGKQRTLKLASPHLVVSTDQVKGSLVKALFEPNAKLSDSLTYDITAWSLPYAYGLDAIASESLVSAAPGTAGENPVTDPDPDAYAWITDWNSMKDARFLADLLKENIRVRYSEVPFSVSGKNFDRGSLIITKTDNAARGNFIPALSGITRKHQKSITSAATGYVDSGRDFGSASVKMIPRVKVAVFYGKPVSTLSFGEIWHFFEQQLRYPVTVLDADNFDTV
ncbi:MAG: zinc carboxypeptidase, partial [Sinomicrobium sp.]|nr:zinc carboxypeptidase [Sinomicrobium sp.]